MTRLDDADREQVDVVFVTTDPARDTEPVLRRYLDRFDPAFVGLTGRSTRSSASAKPLGSPSRRARSCPAAATTSPTAPRSSASTATTGAARVDRGTRPAARRRHPHSLD
jgi:cytochrome oxidase Cu insertion factor (SCO1/SenC/PrrC family)